MAYSIGMAKDENTTIQISKQTRIRLYNIKKYGQTYDDIINELIKLADISNGCE